MTEKPTRRKLKSADEVDTIRRRAPAAGRYFEGRAGQVIHELEKRLFDDVGDQSDPEMATLCANGDLAIDQASRYRDIRLSDDKTGPVNGIFACADGEFGFEFKDGVLVRLHWLARTDQSTLNDMRICGTHA